MSDDTSRQATREIRQALPNCLPELRAFARSLAGDPDRADDLVQEAVTKGWAARDRYQPGTSVRAWLFTILRNSFYSERRKAGREVEDPDEVAALRLATPAEQGDKMALDDLRQALMALPDDQREALILTAASGLSHEEAATILDCAVGTVKSRVSRARSALQHLYRDDAVPSEPERRDAAGAMDSLIAEGERIIAREA